MNSSVHTLNRADEKPCCSGCSLPCINDAQLKTGSRFSFSPAESLLSDRSTYSTLQFRYQLRDTEHRGARQLHGWGFLGAVCHGRPSEWRFNLALQKRPFIYFIPRVLEVVSCNACILVRAYFLHVLIWKKFYAKWSGTHSKHSVNRLPQALILDNTVKEMVVDIKCINRTSETQLK